jgi:hypothetical protein
MIGAAALVLSTLAAQAAPPTGQALSEIIARIEQTADFDYVDEVDWSDRGYYEIEYFTKSGAKVEVKIDPTTGEMTR